MIVGVCHLNFLGVYPKEPGVFVEVSGFSEGGGDRDMARRIAFRYVHKRREKDYQELIENTTIIAVTKLDQQTAELARDMC